MGEKQQITQPLMFLKSSRNCYHDTETWRWRRVKQDRRRSDIERSQTTKGWIQSAKQLGVVGSIAAYVKSNWSQPIGEKLGWVHMDKSDWFISEMTHSRKRTKPTYLREIRVVNVRKKLFKAPVPLTWAPPLSRVEGGRIEKWRAVGCWFGDPSVLLWRRACRIVFCPNPDGSSSS